MPPRMSKIEIHMKIRTVYCNHFNGLFLRVDLDRIHSNTPLHSMAEKTNPDSLLLLNSTIRLETQQVSELLHRGGCLSV